MPHAKLTEKAIAKLRAPTASGTQELWFDTELRGFAVRCSGKTNAKSYIVQRDLPGGKTRRVTIAAVTELALAKAREQARELLLGMRRGVDPKRKGGGQRTLHQTLEAYLQANKELKPRSRAIYTHLVEHHLAPWKDRPIDSITTGEVDDLHRTIAAEVAKLGRHNGNTIANQAIRCFRLLYNWAAHRDDNMPRNPVRLQRSEWHKEAPLRRPIPADKLKDFYAAVLRLPPLGRDYLLLLLYTGLRRREAAALQWTEMDFGEHIIRLPAERTKTKPLELPMSDFVRDLLVARRALGNAKFVFPSYSRSGHIEGARPWTECVTESTGIEFTLHDIRRCYITTAESCNISTYALKALVNHSLGTTVTEGYIGMTADRLREPAQKVCDKLKTLCGVDAPDGAKVVTMR